MSETKRHHKTKKPKACDNCECSENHEGSCNKHSNSDETCIEVKLSHKNKVKNCTETEELTESNTSSTSEEQEESQDPKVCSIPNKSSKSTCKTEKTKDTARKYRRNKKKHDKTYPKTACEPVLVKNLQSAHNPYNECDRPDAIILVGSNFAGAFTRTDFTSAYPFKPMTLGTEWFHKYAATLGKKFNYCPKLIHLWSPLFTTVHTLAMIELLANIPVPPALPDWSPFVIGSLNLHQEFNTVFGAQYGTWEQNLAYVFKLIGQHKSVQFIIDFGEWQQFLDLESAGTGVYPADIVGMLANIKASLVLLFTTAGFGHVDVTVLNVSEDWDGWYSHPNVNLEVPPVSNDEHHRFGSIIRKAFCSLALDSVYNIFLADGTTANPKSLGRNIEAHGWGRFGIANVVGLLEGRESRFVNGVLCPLTPDWSSCEPLSLIRDIQDLNRLGHSHLGRLLVHLVLSRTGFYKRLDDRVGNCSS